MTASTVREKLYDYIRVADEKKLKAIYMMLEDEISEELDWWENAAHMKELDKRYKKWNDGTEKGYTPESIETALTMLKSKRSRK